MIDLERPDANARFRADRLSVLATRVIDVSDVVLIDRHTEIPFGHLSGHGIVDDIYRDEVCSRGVWGPG